MRDSDTLHYGGTEKETEESEVERVVAGDLFRTENRVRSEVPPFLLLCVSVPLWSKDPSPTGGKQKEWTTEEEREGLTDFFAAWRCVNQERAITGRVVFLGDGVRCLRINAAAWFQGCFGVTHPRVKAIDIRR